MGNLYKFALVCNAFFVQYMELAEMSRKFT